MGVQVEPEYAIFDAGWDEQAFLESVCLCAIANCMNRFAMGIGTDAIGTRNFLLDKACKLNSPRQLQ